MEFASEKKLLENPTAAPHLRRKKETGDEVNDQICRPEAEGEKPKILHCASQVAAAREFCLDPGGAGFFGAFFGERSCNAAVEGIVKSAHDSEAF
jgi:hypothetical protein